MADGVLHLQKEAARELVLHPQAPDSAVMDPRNDTKVRQTVKSVVKFVLSAITFSGVQSPKVYFFVSVPIITVLGPLISSVFLMLDNIRTIGVDIHQLNEIGKLKNELKNADLPTNLKNLTLKKISQHKKALIKNTILEVSILAVRVASLVAAALVVGGVAVIPYVIPLISGVAIGAVATTLLIKTVITLIQRPESSALILTSLRLDWNIFCRWAQKTNFNHSKRNYIAALGKMTEEEREVKKLALQAKIEAYHARKSTIKELKRKLTVAGVNDFEHTRSLDLDGKVLKEDSKQRVYLKSTVKEVCETELTESQKNVFIKYFRVNPEKLQNPEIAEQHLKNFRVFCFSRCGAIDRKLEGSTFGVYW